MCCIGKYTFKHICKNNSNVTDWWKKDVVTKKFISVFLIVIVTKLSCKIDKKFVTSCQLLTYVTRIIPCSVYEASLTARSFEHCKYPPRIRCFN